MEGSFNERTPLDPPLQCSSKIKTELTLSRQVLSDDILCEQFGSRSDPTENIVPDLDPNC